MKIIFLISLLFTSIKTFAYPSFISYGYSSCITCHYNGHGSGALTDYGRGVFASEIISNDFTDPKKTEDELSEESGFLGKKKLPDWFHPGFKYRGLWYMTNPGSADSTNKFTNMQADFSAAFHFDPNQKLVAAFSFGYYPVPPSLKDSPNRPSDWISREHYVRYLLNPNFTIFVGLLDKAFGIRTADHTAYSRTKLGLAQNDQTHGVMMIYKTETWEYTPHLFIGNLSQDADIRQKGISFMMEKNLQEFHRIGVDFMTSENNYLKINRIAGHSMYGFGTGNSFLFEAGLNQTKSSSSDAKTAGYALAESMALIRKGYYFLSQAEYYNQTLSTKSPDNLRWTFGFVTFPYMKTEFRLTLVTGRSISDESVISDQWSIQSQLHLSL